ncbi:MAG: hypothetical protein M3506_01410 [Chloroflexota bacterium]|nr:hypothetical protein [Chloroflexota bacterium]
MKRPTIVRAAIACTATAAVAAGAALAAKRRSRSDMSMAQVARKIPAWGKTEVRPPEREHERPYMGSTPSQ